jgi:hypothetical protein
VNLPPIPDADASVEPTAANANHQESASHRPPDAHAVSEDPATAALDPRAAYDLATQLNVQAIRAAVAANPRIISQNSTRLQNAAAQAPQLPATHGAAIQGTNAGSADGPDAADEAPPRRNGKARLPTTVGVSVLLAIAAATALVLTSVERSSGPLAPSALPTKSAAEVPVAVTPSPTAAASTHTAGAKPHRSAIPSRPPSATASTTPPTSATGTAASPSASFTELWWGSTGAGVVDVQKRLEKLNYLRMVHYGAFNGYVVADGICGSDYCQHQQVDPVGIYYNATQMTVQKFQFDNKLPTGNCTAQTYQRLVALTG